MGEILRLSYKKISYLDFGTTSINKFNSWKEFIYSSFVIPLFIIFSLKLSSSSITNCGTINFSPFKCNFLKISTSLLLLKKANSTFVSIPNIFIILRVFLRLFLSAPHPTLIFLYWISCFLMLFSLPFQIIIVFSVPLQFPRYNSW